MKKILLLFLLIPSLVFGQQRNFEIVYSHTQPTVANTTSVTCLAANTFRKYLLVQNNSAANILINLSGGTLTGIAPTSTNLGIVLAAGASYVSPIGYAPTGAVTCYQSSGGAINTISVIEGR